MEPDAKDKTVVTAAEAQRDLISWEKPMEKATSEATGASVKELILVLYEDKGDSEDLPPPLVPSLKPPVVPASKPPPPQASAHDGWTWIDSLMTGHCCRIAYLEDGEDCVQPDRPGCFWCDESSEGSDVS